MSKDSTSDLDSIVGVDRGLACRRTYPSCLGANKEGVDGR